MTDQQWESLLAVLRGASSDPLPTGFIVDSPWLPNWAGHTILDYFTDEGAFFDDNIKVQAAFPRTLFLPGFWSEYGMCTEPSAFGAVEIWGENEFPSAMKVLRSPADIDLLEPPDPRKHGLLPFVVKRLKHLEPKMLAAGHRVRFAVARGPLNIASFLMGTTEFMMALRTDPEAAHRLLTLITDFLVEWIALQREAFPSIDGLLILDDIVGFVGPRDFDAFALPYLERTFKRGRRRQVLPQRRAVQDVRAAPRRHRREPPQLRHPAHAERHAEVDRRRDHAPRQRAAAGRAGRGHAGRRHAVRAGDAGRRRGSVAADRLVRGRHAAGSPDREHPGARRCGGGVRELTGSRVPRS